MLNWMNGESWQKCMLVMFLMKIKFNISSRFLATKLHAVSCTQAIKTYCKATTYYQQAMWEWEHAHENIF